MSCVEFIKLKLLMDFGHLVLTEGLDSVSVCWATTLKLKYEDLWSPEEESQWIR